MNFDRVRAIVAALEGQELPNAGYFDMGHDILYIPWDKPTGDVAEKLEAAGCHFEEETQSWASF